MGTKRERQPGVWQLRVSAGFDPIDGKRRVITETVRGSKRAADQRLAELQAEANRSLRDLSGQSLRATIAAWRAQAGHAKSTARNYDLAVSSIPGKFLTTPIDKIRAAHLRDLYGRVEADHGVHRTRQVHAVISGALTYAWRQEWLRENPARRVQPPAQPVRNDTAPSPEGVRAMLELVADQPERYAWVFVAAAVGARPGEYLALHWSDVDLDRGELKIHKALDPIDGTEKETKTRNRRTVAIGPDAVEALRRWRVAFLERAISVGVHPVADPYVFVNDFTGATPWRTDLATKRFGKLRDRAGVDSRLYDLRHYSASQMLNEGVTDTATAKRLGHDRVATTTDTYGHLVRATDRAAAEILERGLTR